ncbi:MAG TPA: 3-hydroxyacyl-CoA dehydrogenase NAD-binding domain-containing protein [Nocardioidaceae bacterium]
MTETLTAAGVVPVEESTIRYAIDSDGIVLLTLDDPRSAANTMNDQYAASMAGVVDRLYTERDEITGVVITSAKKTFFAGGDLVSLAKTTPADAEAVFDQLQRIKADLRRLELLGKPVVAAINGSALGAGLEIALATHHRIALDDGRLEIGCPEVTLGLLPGAGGVTRTVRMLGLQDALLNVLLKGQRHRPAAALALGLVDELVADREALLPAARKWVLDHRDDAGVTTQPWDRPEYRMPGGIPSSPTLAQHLPAFPANLRKQLKGAPYPAPRAILAAAVEGAQTDFETATRIESRYFVDLVTGPISKNMIQAFFFDLQAINSGTSRPNDVPAYTARKVGIIGAGMMGAGIAYECARAGMEVVLEDVSVDAAGKGKAHSLRLLDKQVDQGRLSTEQREEILARIQPAGDPSELAGCDLVIEAVFEDQELKHRVFREVEEVVDGDALLCSNTSTLPITGLAEAVQRQRDFIGLHFFSPVERMPLVEIIVGEQTSDEAVAKAYDVARQIKKTPIVVNDSRGFFTSRVFGTLVLEGVAMLGEGIDPITIERAATQMGFPAPPLAMVDEVSLVLPRKIAAEAAKAAEASGAGAFASPAMAVVDRMVDEFGRLGKAAGAGFYEYPADGRKFLWPGLWEHGVDPAKNPVDDATFRDLQERFTFVMSLETIRCVEEGVLRSTAEANIGSIFGIGFPALYGGALQYVNGYAGGVAGFAARAQELAASYGPRFTPPPLLLTHAETNSPF